MSTVAQEAVWNPGQPSRQAMAPRESNTDGIRLRLHLECPDEATEETFLRTLDLVQDEDFQHARRRLWTWESTLSPKGSPENYSGSSEISGLWYVDHGEEQDRMAARLAEIRPFLDERAWRLLLGAEARAIGYGGMKLVAAAARAKADTVSRGVHELESGVVPDGRWRAVGAGRPAAEVADPGLVAALEELVDQETRGDPQSALRWTTKSTSHLAESLRSAG